VLSASDNSNDNGIGGHIHLLSGSSNQDGGDITLKSGVGAMRRGGSIFIEGGESQNLGSGGNISLKSGSSVNQNGGDTNISSGFSENSNGGNIYIETGTSESRRSGSLFLRSLYF
jgi:hypothetical protein